MDRTLISQAMEDYLKAIYKLVELGGPVTTSALAEYMGVAPASVTNMCKKLAELNLLQYEPYQGVKFTPAGQKLALEVVRHHRLLELYLAEALGVPFLQPGSMPLKGSRSRRGRKTGARNQRRPGRSHGRGPGRPEL